MHNRFLVIFFWITFSPDKVTVRTVGSVLYVNLRAHFEKCKFYENSPTFL